MAVGIKSLPIVCMPEDGFEAKVLAAPRAQHKPLRDVLALDDLQIACSQQRRVHEKDR